MKTRKKKNIFMFICVILVLPTLILAYPGDSVRVAIKSDQEWTKSERIHNCSNRMEYDASNFSNSTNSLYAICYRYNGIFPSTEYNSIYLTVGRSGNKSWTLEGDDIGKDFYLELDPNGFRRTGCNGEGKLYD